MVKETDDKSEISKKPQLRNFKERTEYLRTGGGTGGLGHRGTLEWHLSQDMCAISTESDNYSVLKQLKSMLEKSRTGKAFLDDADVTGINIEFDSQVAVSQFYPEMNMITLNPNQPSMTMMIHLIGELRRGWQNERGLLFNPLEYQPDEAVLLNRAQYADTAMMCVRIGWELKLLGDNVLWDYMLSSSNADIARCFEMHARNDFRSLNSGDAARKAYDMWFASERMRFYDKDIIHQMLLDENVSESNHGTKELNSQELYGFASMPYGRNYMSLSGYRDPTDKDYSIVEDRSNANFLWFIKFERSFQAREREMMQNTAASPLNIIDINGWKQQRLAE